MKQRSYLQRLFAGLSSAQRVAMNLHRCEDGVSYHLGFTLVMPVYAAMIIVAVETALLLNARIAVQHAAYAAARAAAVWLPADELPLESRLGMVHLAAVNALAPTASGRHQVAASRYFQYPRGAERAWADAYHRYTTSHSADFLHQKWRYAASATRIQVEQSSAGATVRLEYEYPFHTSVAGRLLGRRSSWFGGSFSTYNVPAVAMLQVEVPRNAAKTLGIVVHPDLGFRSQPY